MFDGHYTAFGRRGLQRSGEGEGGAEEEEGEGGGGDDRRFEGITIVFDGEDRAVAAVAVNEGRGRECEVTTEVMAAAGGGAAAAWRAEATVKYLKIKGGS